MTTSQQKKPWLIAGSLLFALIFAIWFIRSPIAALDSIKEAAQNGNVQELNDRVDFTSLRSSIKLMISTDAGDVASKPTPGSRLAHLLAGALASPIVDALVTPESLVFLLNGKMPTDHQSSEEKSSAQISTNWHGLSLVELVIHPGETEKAKIALVMRRNWLTWKLVGINRVN